MSEGDPTFVPAFATSNPAIMAVVDSIFDGTDIEYFKRDHLDAGGYIQYMVKEEQRQAASELLKDIKDSNDFIAGFYPDY